MSTVRVLRWLFGLRGAAFVNGALADCFRCDAAEIDAYLSSIADRLDVDGSGALDALTDGVLILRHLFGFSDAA